MEEPGRLQSMGLGLESDTTERFHFDFSLSYIGEGNGSVFAWRIPGTGEPGGLLSLGSHSQTRLKQLHSSMILNTEFQRISRRDKKTFLSDKCKEIEENNRIGKTRDLFKIIRNTKGTFHAKMGSIKDRNGMDLTEAEDIKKRWQEYMEELYRKDLNEPDNHNGVITDLEPDILECEVKGALESITMNKAMEVIEFQLSYFKS